MDIMIVGIAQLKITVDNKEHQVINLYYKGGVHDLSSGTSTQFN